MNKILFLLQSRPGIICVVQNSPNTTAPHSGHSERSRMCIHFIHVSLSFMVICEQDFFLSIFYFMQNRICI